MNLKVCYFVAAFLPVVRNEFGRGGAERGKLVSTVVFHVSIKWLIRYNRSSLDAIKLHQAPYFLGEFTPILNSVL